MANADSIDAAGTPEPDRNPAPRVSPYVARQVAALQRMTVRELKTRYAEVFGEQARSGNRQWLLRRIAWRLQALAEGDLSERARQRALELANDADLRLRAPRTPQPGPDAAERTATHGIAFERDERLPLPGTVLTRDYKGETVRVTVLPEGFEYAGQVYGSLTAVARAVTGAHWNGYHFFGIGRNRRGA